MKLAYRKCKIGDLGIVVTGRTPPSLNAEYFGEIYPFVTPTDMHDKKSAHTTERYLSSQGAVLLKNNLIPAGSVAVSCIGWQMGKSILISRPSFTNQQLNTVIPHHDVDSDYLYYLLTTKREELFSIASAAGVRTPILNKSSFCNIDIEIPDVTTQRKISSLLNNYDNLIENNNRRIANLEDMAQSLYREWFVKYRFPGHQDCKFIDSALGKIPDGWTAISLSNAIIIDRGRSYKSSELSVEGIGHPFLNLKNVLREGGFRRDGLKWYNGPFKPSNVAKPNDIIMAVTDMTQERAVIARAARVPEMGHEEFVLSMDLIKITAQPEYNATFIYSLLRYSEFPHAVKAFANGANVLHLSPQVVADYVALFPNKELSEKFSNLVSPIHALQDSLSEKNDNLKIQRDMLLPKLISGQINI